MPKRKVEFVADGIVTYLCITILISVTAVESQLPTGKVLIMHGSLVLLLLATNTETKYI
jgi:hypothetical protein